MPIPYSNDLRKKVIDLLITHKQKPKEVASLLNIHPTTITRWHKRYKEEGDCRFQLDNKSPLRRLATPQALENRACRAYQI